MKKSPRTPRFYSPEQWKEILEDWQKSGLSLKRYCEQRDIIHSAFSRWRNKLLSSGPESLALPKKNQPQPPRFHTPEQWKEFIEEWQKGELSVAAYCSAKGLSRSSFQKWQEKLFGSPSSQNTSAITTESPPRSMRVYPLKHWEKIIKAWQASGLPERIFCFQKDLSCATFRNWKKKILNPQNSSQASLDIKGISAFHNKPKPTLEDYFIPATIMDRESPDSSSLDQQSLSQQKIEVIFAQGHRLHVYGSVDWNGLHSWLTPLLLSSDRKE